MDRAAIHRSSFSAAARLLPRNERAPTLRLYGACRALDDLADKEGGPQAQAALDDVVQCLRTRQGTGGPQALVFLDLHKTHGLNLASAIGLAETLRGDLRPRRLDTEADLVAYAHGAAGTVGEMMCDLLCAHEVPASARLHAADLGIAMQLTNIARDVQEDARMGRRYLPGAWCPAPPEHLVAPEPATRAMAGDAILRTLRLAERHYSNARRGYGVLPPRSRLAVALAAERYRQIGLAIASCPEIVWERRARPNALGHIRCGARGFARGLRPTRPGSAGRRPYHA